MSLWRHNVCFEDGFEIFCKGNTCNSKIRESFKVVFSHIRAKMGRNTT